MTAMQIPSTSAQPGMEEPYPQAEGELRRGSLSGKNLLRISVIVPVRNGSLHLPRCLEALGRSGYPEFEVIVVDDCSTDNTSQVAALYGARCLRTPQTQGPAAARNLGARHAKGEILLFVDADVVLPPDTLTMIADDFAVDSGLAAVFGSYDDKPPWKSFISQYKNLMHHYVHQTSNETATTFWAGCGAMRSSIFEVFGGFDAETYSTPSVEDIALGLKLNQRGYRIRLDKRIEVKHLKRWTLRNLLRADILHRAVPWTKLILSTRQLPQDLNLNYASRVSSLLVAVLLVGLLVLPFSLGGYIRVRPLILLPLLAAIAVALLYLNLGVYRFFLRKRGWWFAARCVLAHWIYYLYSGVTFVLCLVLHVLHLLPSPVRDVSVRDSQK